MKRNEKESNGMIFRNQSESIGINRKMTGNDRKNERITSGLRADYERKRLETTAGSPCGSATSRNGFLGNSPIFRAFSSIFHVFSSIFRENSVYLHRFSFLIE